MTAAFDALYAWSKTIPGSQFEDSTSQLEIASGRSTRYVDNQLIMVSGDIDGKRVVITWTDYMQDGFGDDADVYTEVLDILVANSEQKLEGELHPRGFINRMMCMIGMGGGWTPVKHDLFGQYRLDKSETHGETCFERDGYCDALLPLLTEHQPMKIQYQEGSGADVFFQGRVPTVDSLNSYVALANIAAGRTAQS